MNKFVRKRLRVYRVRSACTSYCKMKPWSGADDTHATFASESVTLNTIRSATRPADERI